MKRYKFVFLLFILMIGIVSIKTVYASEIKGVEAVYNLGNNEVTRVIEKYDMYIFKANEKYYLSSFNGNIVINDMDNITFIGDYLMVELIFRYLL